MSYSYPSIADFQVRFSRDFPFGNDPENNILDQDIARAYIQTNLNFNPGLFNAQEIFSEGFLLLSAHYLVRNIRMAGQGLSGQYNFLQASKSAGPLSEGFSIPQRILDDPFFSMLTKTNYGAMYLELILPQLSGAIFPVVGSTRP